MLCLATPAHRHAAATADICLDRGSLDNITVMAVGLPARPMPTPYVPLAFLGARVAAVDDQVAGLEPNGGNCVHINTVYKYRFLDTECDYLNSPLCEAPVANN